MPVTVCELLGLHIWCEARTLEFEMITCPKTGVVVQKARSGGIGGSWGDSVITARTDGLACTRCGLFVPEAV